METVNRDDSKKKVVKVAPGLWILVTDDEAGNKRAAKFAAKLKRSRNQFYENVKVKKWDDSAKVGHSADETSLI